MRELQNLKFDSRACCAELGDLQRLLCSKEALKEREDVLPFFRGRANLSALLGSYHPDVIQFDRLGYEYSLFGDFLADLVVGDSRTGAYCLSSRAPHQTVFLPPRSATRRRGHVNLSTGSARLSIGSGNRATSGEPTSTNTGSRVEPSTSWRCLSSDETASSA